MEETQMKDIPRKIPSLDLNFWAFHHMHANTSQLVVQGGRVVGLFDPDETFYRLSDEYNSNCGVKVLDYVNSQRQLRAMMMSLKGQQTENGKGAHNGYRPRSSH
jgi:hypothetical protein